MSVLLVSYDLDAPNRNYDQLYEKIKSYGAWAHALESVWLIDTSSDPADVRDDLKKVLDSGDQLLVIRLHEHWATNFSDKITKWMKSTDRTWD
ncbi:hypothetical protein SAMN05444358_101578 [Ruegeria halocynthiae]|uniref:Uncharacterized protein n=1 Tax=Ruegeria halocynthiae TaxID=985054 RepID=A0A1H2STA6_9RHOB|nr:hypothetical protein [Ruegeria halocynthiae]SDW34818.1 hypothetical protein SAMN05444358_101578 [Ruegeria halocynthiae]